jgi:hypothetical protein
MKTKGEFPNCDTQKRITSKYVQRKKLFLKVFCFFVHPKFLIPVLHGLFRYDGDLKFEINSSIILIALQKNTKDKNRNTRIFFFDIFPQLS